MWLGSDRLKKATAITSGVLLKKLFNMLNNDKHRNKGFAKEAIIGGQNPADQSVQLLQLRSSSAGGSSDGTSGFVRRQLEENRAREEWNVRADEWASKTSVPQTLYNDHYAGAEAETGDKDPREAKYQKGQNLKRQWERDVEGPLRRSLADEMWRVYCAERGWGEEAKGMALVRQERRVLGRTAGRNAPDGVVSWGEFLAFQIQTPQQLQLDHIEQIASFARPLYPLCFCGASVTNAAARR